MPRISYLDKSKNGYDDTETTVAQIEEKVAEISAILKGLLDEDNLLQYEDDTTPVNIPPSNVTDMPLDTRPVDYSVKFFGNISGDDSVIEKLWTPLHEKASANPAFASVGGIGDGEIQHSITFEANGEIEGGYRKLDYKSKITEVPTYYVPMTWEDLYPYVDASNAYCKVEWDSEGYPTIDSKFASEDEFIEQMNSYSKYGFAGQLWFNKDIDINCDLDGNSFMSLRVLNINEPVFNESSNSLEWSSSIQPESITQTEGYCNLRLIRENLFRILP